MIWPSIRVLPPVLTQVYMAFGPPWGQGDLSFISSCLSPKAAEVLVAGKEGSRGEEGEERHYRLLFSVLSSCWWFGVDRMNI